MNKPAQQPRDRRHRSPWRWWPLMLLLILIGSGLFLVWRNLAEPVYAFDFSELSDPLELETLLAFSEQMQAAQDWQLAEAQDGAWADALAAIIRLPENRSAVGVADLMRAVKTPAATRSAEVAPQLPEQTAALNGVLTLLDDRLSSESLAQFRSAEFTPQTLAARLRQEMDSVVRLRRWRVRNASLESGEFRKLLSRYRVPDFPFAAVPPNKLTEKQAARQQRWLAAWQAACDEQLLPLADWYRDLAAAQIVDLGDGSSLFVQRIEGTASADGVKRFESIADYQVMISLQRQLPGETPGDPPREVTCSLDSGVRANGLRLSVGSDGPKVVWPPQSLSVVPPVLEAILYELGLPGQFMLRDVDIQLPGGSDPRIELALHLAHREFDGCELSQQITLAPDTLGVSLQELQQTLAVQPIARLRDRLTQLKKFRGLPVNIQTVEDRFVCQVVLPNVGDLHFDLLVSGQAAVLWAGSLTGAERRRIVQRVCDVDERLLAVRHLVALDEMLIVNSPAELSGTLRILGSVLGGRDLSGIRWTITSGGQAVMPPLDDGTIAYLQGLQQIAKPVVPQWDEQVIEQTVRDELAAAFPLLEDGVELTQAESTPHGWLVRLDLRLGDWPPITLGPAVIDPTDGQQVADAIKVSLENLLSEDNVKRFAEHAWRNKYQHPRYGAVRSRLKSWSAARGEAEMDCLMPLGADFIEMPWTETVQVASRLFQRQDAIGLCRALEGKRQNLESQLRNLLSNLAGSEVIVGLEPDGFGAGQWLRLSPPAVKIRLGCKIPGLPLSVGAGGILVDQQGVRMPPKLSARYRHTFPLPHCCISDPMIEIDTQRYGATIGCRITPPFPSGFVPPRLNQTPGKSLEPEQIVNLTKQFGIAEHSVGLSRIRWDNPWLHVVYLEGHLGGTLNDRQFTTRAHVRVLDTLDAAQTRLTVDFDDEYIQGLMSSNQFAPQWLPRFDGRFWAAANEGFQLDSRFNVAKAKVQGTAVFDVSRPQQPPRVLLHGRALLPMVGPVTVIGESDVQFQNPYITATGRVRLQRVGRAGILAFTFHANRFERRFQCRWTSGDTSVDFAVVEAADLPLEETTLAEKLDAVVRQHAEGRIRIASADEQTHIRKLPKPPTMPQPATPVFAEFSRAEGAVGAANSNRSNLAWSFTGPSHDEVRFYSVEDDTNIFVTPRDSLPVKRLADCHFILWEAERALAMIDLSQRRTYLALWGETGTLVGPPLDVTANLGAIAADLYADGATESQSNLVWGARLAAKHFIKMRLAGKDVANPLPIGDGYLVPYNDDEEQKSLFCWAAGSDRFELALAGPLAQTLRESPDFARRLAKQRPKSLGYVVADEEGQRGRVAIVYRTSDASAYELVTDSAVVEPDSILIKPLEDTSRDAVFKLGAVCAREVWSGRLPLPQRAVACLGKQGACLVSSDGVYVAQREQLAAMKPAFHWITMLQLVDWPNDGARHLPAKYKLRADRERIGRDMLELERLAAVVVTDWQQTREQNEWGANPLGLLIDLATATPSTK